ncbi:MAG TPA: DinB family protein [Longimicrobiales bacterium]|nr:DinB family protein [Longimicrobiales bacterium]
MVRSRASRDGLLALLDEAFDRKAWHGPNLMGALRGVDAELAAWRPAPGRNTIWELTLHCAYWKNVVSGRIGGERPELPWPGANFPEVPAGADAREWSRSRRALRDAHRALRAAVEGLSDIEVASPGPGQKRPRLEHIRGAAFHDVYHAGQISLIARMGESRKR